MRNLYFPHWVTANTVLEGLIEEHFGVYVYGDQDIELSFLPKEVFGVIPEEDLNKFVDIYNSVANLIGHKLHIEEIFNTEFKFHPNTPTEKARLKNRIERELHKYNDQNPISLKDTMKGHLGIPKYAFFLQ